MFSHTYARRTLQVGGIAIAVLAISGMVGRVSPALAARVNALCNNTSSDAATIQSAINTSASGDEIVISGLCSLTSTITLLDNRTYRGDSRSGTVIRQANGVNLPAMVASSSWVNDITTVSSSVRIERLTLDGNRANNSGTVPLMLRTWNSRVYDIEIANAPTDGIRVSNLSRNGVHLTNTSVNSIISDVFIHDSGGAGVRVVDPDNFVTDWILERSWIASSGGSAVDLDNAAGWQVRGLHIYGVQLHGVNAKRCFNTGLHDNYIEDFGRQGTAGTTYFGVRCTVQGDVGNAISGNRVNQMFGLPANGTFVYIGLDGVNYGTGHVAVVGNTVVGRNTARETGLSYVKGNGLGLSVVSTGNLVDLVGVPKAVGAGVMAGVGS